MSMTESEAIERLKQEAKNKRADADWKWRHGRLNSDDLIESAENMEQLVKWLEEIQQYRAIGTVSEFRELKEKATVQKSILYPFPKCPICKCSLAHALVNYCHACGQKLGLSEGKE